MNAFGYEISPEEFEWQRLVDWVAASIVTGFLYTVAAQAIGATWSIPGWLPGWMAPVQAAMVSGGFYSVTVGMAGVLVARRYGYGRVVGVVLSAFASTFPFLIWGWIRLPDQTRTDMWTALRLDGEYRGFILAALVIAIVVIAIANAAGVVVYSLVRGRDDAGDAA